MQIVASSRQWSDAHPRTSLLLAAGVWLALYSALIPASEALVSALPLDRASHLGSAVQFFLYDTPKVLLLLTGVVFVMGMVNSTFTPERTRALLAGRTEGVANVMAAGLGVVTPFCSCSAVPLFMGFVQAGVPLGVTFSFLIAAPMVNEVALTLLFGLFGWRIGALYLGLGLAVAVAAGWVIGRLQMEAFLEDWVRDMPRVTARVGDRHVTWTDRIEAGVAAVRDIVGRVWPYILAGIAIGAIIHGHRVRELPEHHRTGASGRQREGRGDPGGESGGTARHHRVRDPVHPRSGHRRHRGARGRSSESAEGGGMVEVIPQVTRVARA